MPDTSLSLYTLSLYDDYKHTVYFSTVTAQRTFFTTTAHRRVTLTDLSYQRVGEQSFRVSLSYETVRQYVYLSFDNGGKTYYAFITNISYVNDAVTEITYNIDVIQTYLFDVTLEPSLIDREHVTVEQDDAYSNLLPEPVNISEYVYSNYNQLVDVSDSAVIVAYNDSDNVGNMYDRVYNASTLRAFNTNDVSGINDFLSGYIDTPDNITAIYMCPKFALTGITIPTGGINIGTTDRGYTEYTQSDATGQSLALDVTSDFDGYIPKNRKLYTYPYNYLCINNADGQSLCLRYEFFDELKPTLAIQSKITYPVSCSVVPCSYKGVPSYTTMGGYVKLNSESINLSSYPTCSWIRDNYQTWMSQNLVSNTIGMVGAIAPLMGANPIIGAGSIAGIAASAYKASISADVAHGSYSNGDLTFAVGDKNFYVARAHITADYARYIDDFFEMYGYKSDKIKVPNRNVRPIWTYTKTVDCNLQGRIPSNIIAQIKTIYNNGITFWSNYAYMYNYNLDNHTY